MRVLPVPVVADIEEVDFHLHTRTSDGSLTEKQVVDLLCTDHVSVAAFTDHDRTEAPRDPVLRRYLDQLGEAAPQIVPGVEITCALPAPLAPGGSQEVHIVGLGCNPYHPGLRKALTALRLAQDARIKACVDQLRADGYDISYRHLGRAAGGRMITSGTIARLLVEAGYAQSIGCAKAELVAPRIAGYNELPERTTLDPNVAIRLIREAGGVAILAHPHRNVPTHDAEQLRGLLARLAQDGLDGVEIYRHGIDDQHRPLYQRLADEAGLLASGGSDFHQPLRDGEHRSPGDVDAPAELWPPIEQRIRARGGVTDVRELPVRAARGASAAERFRLG